jgi:hypothetical protein
MFDIGQPGRDPDRVAQVRERAGQDVARPKLLPAATGSAGGPAKPIVEPRAMTATSLSPDRDWITSSTIPTAK